MVSDEDITERFIERAEQVEKGKYRLKEASK